MVEIRENLLRQYAELRALHAGVLIFIQRRAVLFWLCDETQIFHPCTVVINDKPRKCREGTVGDAR
jgi:hypothetical protein